MDDTKSELRERLVIWYISVIRGYAEIALTSFVWKFADFGGVKLNPKLVLLECQFIVVAYSKTVWKKSVWRCTINYDEQMAPDVAVNNELVGS